jgi:hypothetical protein
MAILGLEVIVIAHVRAIESVNVIIFFIAISYLITSNSATLTPAAL